MKNPEWDYVEFKKSFRLKTGLDLDSYKDKQMERRIRQMIQREGRAGFADFFQHLTANNETMHKFMNYLTINTSGFFRDISVYEKLQSVILPELYGKFRRLQIWSAGCSNGEEPYSLAIILNELGYMANSHIMAVDFDLKALENAQLGKYSPRQLDKVSKELLNKYFRPDEEHFYVDEKLKKNIVFNRQNLLELQPGKLEAIHHLILCRNVFIYFKTEVQERIIAHFSSTLLPGGYFIIGCAEYINEPERFSLFRKYPAIYQKK